MNQIEDAAMRKRLLYDGHGSGDDKKITNLTRNITRLCLIDNQDEFPKLYANILRDISLISTIADRQIKLSARCDRALLELNQEIEQQERQIKEANSDLAKLQLELEYVEQLKKISIYPDCVTTHQAITEIENKKEHLMERLKKYRLHIKSVIESCRSLRKIFEDT